MRPGTPRPITSASEEQDSTDDDAVGGRGDWTYQLAFRPRGGASEPRRPWSSSGYHGESGQDAPTHTQSTIDDASPQHLFDPLDSVIVGASKRPRKTIEIADKGITHTLRDKGAVAAMAYYNESPNPHANDIWPHCRSLAKLPARYFFLHPNQLNPPHSERRSCEESEDREQSPKQSKEANHFSPCTSSGRPKWNLPVELVELIAAFLSRDDIKALRLVSRELNHNVSQAMFQTVVVPFNTEIYGMLGNELKSDRKGKKRAKFDLVSYSWKNFSGDENYNGHGLDVFRGFGRHILRYGMSFDVDEDTLAVPPVKQPTENKISFWGRYDWPHEEYRRFDAVAGLETAADETPRMKIAFSALTKVKELALSINSGLGWLSGPDKSIRSQILRKPSRVFGTSKAIPDRRTQAQQELWRYIQSCYQEVGSDIRHATLYKIEGQIPLSELEDVSMPADAQPKIPYLDPQLIHEATPHDMADIPVPTSFDDPYVLERFITVPSSSGIGVLFASAISPPDAGQVVNPIIPANLTQAQQEWLLETEWAQRAFISSYMLSIIDNSTTFQLVHSLNLSGLSDCYLHMLSRSDFWDTLPNLHEITLMVIPGWRTVHKDEAGFVDTSLVNPALGTNTLFSLLDDHIACRPNIRSLTVGWTTGGEHAEGLYARNKLLFPAPVVNWQVPSGRPASVNLPPLVETDSARFQTWLLKLPHVERLRLKNCWITPTGILQFVKFHDPYHLKELILDSVSLTAILRTNPSNTAQVAAQQAPIPPNNPAQLGMNAIWGGNQFLPGQQQVLQVYIHTLQMQLQQLQANAAIAQQNHIATLQTQLQNRLQQLHNLYPQNHPPAQGQSSSQNPAPGLSQTSVQPQLNQQNTPLSIITALGHIAAQVYQLHSQATVGHHNVFAQPMHHPMPMNNQATSQPQSALRVRPRLGSWMDIIDSISPGTNLSDFGSIYSKADEERTTSLKEIHFISCGYARLYHAPFDQSALDTGHGAATNSRHPWFNRRMAALSPAMLSAKCTYLGEIVQDVNPVELAALDSGWNLRTGWDDREEAHAVEFDGCLPGGTGRFTGTIRESDRMVNEASQNSAKSE